MSEGNGDGSLPRSIAKSEFHLMGATLVCHVLDDGSRVIEADSVSRFLRMLRDAGHRLTEEDARELARFCLGTDKKRKP